MCNIQCVPYSLSSLFVFLPSFPGPNPPPNSRVFGNINRRSSQGGKSLFKQDSILSSGFKLVPLLPLFHLRHIFKCSQLMHSTSTVLNKITLPFTNLHSLYYLSNSGYPRDSIIIPHGKTYTFFLNCHNAPSIFFFLQIMKAYIFSWFKLDNSFMSVKHPHN